MINSVLKLHEFCFRNAGHSMEDRPSIIHYVVQQEIVASIHQFIHQGKRTHSESKIDSSNSKKQLRCRKCSNRTTFKCEKCGSFRVVVIVFSF